MQHVTKLRIDVQLHPLIAGTYVYQEVIQSVSEKGTVVIFYGKKLKGGGGGERRSGSECFSVLNKGLVISYLSKTAVLDHLSSSLFRHF